MKWTFLVQLKLDLVTRGFWVSFAISEKIVQIKAEMAILSPFKVYLAKGCQTAISMQTDIPLTSDLHNPCHFG